MDHGTLATRLEGRWNEPAPLQREPAKHREGTDRPNPEDQRRRPRRSIIETISERKAATHRGTPEHRRQPGDRGRPDVDLPHQDRAHHGHARDRGSPGRGPLEDRDPDRDRHQGECEIVGHHPDRVSQHVRRAGEGQDAGHGDPSVDDPRRGTTRRPMRGTPRRGRSPAAAWSRNRRPGPRGRPARGACPASSRCRSRRDRATAIRLRTPAPRGRGCDPCRWTCWGSGRARAGPGRRWPAGNPSNRTSGGSNGLLRVSSTAGRGLIRTSDRGSPPESSRSRGRSIGRAVRRHPARTGSRRGRRGRSRWRSR